MDCAAAVCHQCAGILPWTRVSLYWRICGRRTRGRCVRAAFHPPSDRRRRPRGAAPDRSDQLFMTNETIYQIWRPENSPWSKWVKPVVFPFLSPEDHSPDEYSVPNWKVLLHPDTTIIADLPGAEGISAGIALARAGYLPVLLYNACPTGTGTFESASAEFVSIRNSQPVSPPVVVDMSSILTALCATSKELASLNLFPQAPPVFMLDANRRGLAVP